MRGRASAQGRARGSVMRVMVLRAYRCVRASRGHAPARRCLTRLDKTRVSRPRACCSAPPHSSADGAPLAIEFRRMMGRRARRPAVRARARPRWEACGTTTMKSSFKFVMSETTSSSIPTRPINAREMVRARATTVPPRAAAQRPLPRPAVLRDAVRLRRHRTRQRRRAHRRKILQPRGLSRRALRDGV